MVFDHFGIVVKSLSGGRDKVTAILGIREWTTTFSDSVNGVSMQFGRDDSGICYELLEPLGDHSPVRSALSERRAILNHIAYRVADLEAAAEHMRRTGCARTGDPKPAIAYGGRRIQFFVTPLSFIVELIEAPDHRHEFLSMPFATAASKA